MSAPSTEDQKIVQAEDVDEDDVDDLEDVEEIGENDIAKEVEQLQGQVQLKPPADGNGQNQEIINGPDSGQAPSSSSSSDNSNNKNDDDNNDGPQTNVNNVDDEDDDFNFNFSLNDIETAQLQLIEQLKGELGMDRVQQIENQRIEEERKEQKMRDRIELLEKESVKMNQGGSAATPSAAAAASDDTDSSGSESSSEEDEESKSSDVQQPKPNDDGSMPTELQLKIQARKKFLLKQKKLKERQQRKEQRKEMKKKKKISKEMLNRNDSLNIQQRQTKSMNNSNGNQNSNQTQTEKILQNFVENLDVDTLVTSLFGGGGGSGSDGDGENILMKEMQEARQSGGWNVQREKDGSVVREKSVNKQSTGTAVTVTQNGNTVTETQQDSNIDSINKTQSTNSGNDDSSDSFRSFLQMMAQQMTATSSNNQQNSKSNNSMQRTGSFKGYRPEGYGSSSNSSGGKNDHSYKNNWNSNQQQYYNNNSNNWSNNGKGQGPQYNQNMNQKQSSQSASSTTSVPWWAPKDHQELSQNSQHNTQNQLQSQSNNNNNVLSNLPALGLLLQQKGATLLLSATQAVRKGGVQTQENMNASKILHAKGKGLMLKGKALKGIMAAKGNQDSESNGNTGKNNINQTLNQNLNQNSRRNRSRTPKNSKDQVQTRGNGKSPKSAGEKVQKNLDETEPQNFFAPAEKRRKKEEKELGGGTSTSLGQDSAVSYNVVNPVTNSKGGSAKGYSNNKNLKGGAPILAPPHVVNKHANAIGIVTDFKTNTKSLSMPDSMKDSEINSGTTTVTQTLSTSGLGSGITNSLSINSTDSISNCNDNIDYANRNVSLDNEAVQLAQGLSEITKQIPQQGQPETPEEEDLPWWLVKEHESRHKFISDRESNTNGTVDKIDDSTDPTVLSKIGKEKFLQKKHEEKLKKIGEELFNNNGNSNKGNSTVTDHDKRKSLLSQSATGGHVNLPSTKQISSEEYENWKREQNRLQEEEAEMRLKGLGRFEQYRDDW